MMKYSYGYFTEFLIPEKSSFYKLLISLESRKKIQEQGCISYGPLEF